MDTQEHKEREALIRFRDIAFRQKDQGTVRGLFLGRYHFDIALEQLSKIGPVRVEDGALHFSGVDEGYARKRFQPMLDEAFGRLRHINYDKPTVYVHRGSGIPLIGTNEFGIVDRGSNIIEVKPLTGCNLQCPYCSVDEGKNDKTHDYIVELAYLLEAASQVAKTRQHPVEFHIGPQGEPLLYPRFADLVSGLKAIPNCALVTVVTNGSLLTEKFIDQLAQAGLDKINLSLNAMTQEAADKMAGRRYPLEHVLKMVKYCQGKINVIVAPTIVPGWNDSEVEGLVQLGSQLKGDFPVLGFQNFLHYPRGRNPAASRGFDEFFAMLKPYEEQYNIKLTGFSKDDFRIHDEPELPKPFRKNDIVKAKVVCHARYRGEIVAAANGRCVTVSGHDAHLLPIGKEVRVRIVRDKHNIFKGVLP
jgi:uncharacterized Fe-S cluster-containing radical SAM superfamily enzyme